MAFRGVLFDLGGTLFRYTDVRAHFDGMLRELASEHGIDEPLEAIRSVYREVMAARMAEFHGQAYYLHRDLFAAAHRDLLARFGVRPEREDALYEGQREVGLGAVEPRPGVHATLEALRARDLHLGIVSNIDDDQFEPLWSQMGLDRYFHATTTSEEARSCKPDPRIYHHALAKAPGLVAEEVVFVGDSPPHDVLGAKRLGMTTVLITSRQGELAPEQRPDHVIREIPELLEIVGA